MCITALFGDKVLCRRKVQVIYGSSKHWRYFTLPLPQHLSLKSQLEKVCGALFFLLSQKIENFFNNVLLNVS